MKSPRARTFCWLAAAFGALLQAMLWQNSLWAQPSSMGEWSGVITWGQAGGIEAIHTHLLPTGKVLFWSTWRESVGLWDPNTGQFSLGAFPNPAGGSTPYNPFCSGHAWLPDGRLFIAGGHVSNENGLSYANIYDPWTNTWANNVPNMPALVSPPAPYATGQKGRWYPTALTLGNGDILVTSGSLDTAASGPADWNPLPQVYEVATNTWRNLTTAYKQIPTYPRMMLMADGRAISLGDYYGKTEILDTAGTGSWQYLTQTLDGDTVDYGPAVMYDAGKVAWFGGGNAVPTQHVSLIDLNQTSPTWTHAAEDMAQPRRQNNATILADGTVLITGGTQTPGFNFPAGKVRTPEIWDPVTQDMTQVAQMSEIYRGYHSTAMLLPDGRVLVTGGDHDTGGYQQNLNAEIYSPAYLFNGPRPTVSSAPAAAELGQTILVQTPDGASIDDVTFIAPGSVTHAQNFGQRADHLEFTEAPGGIYVTLPSNQNTAPPGYYMMFLINDNGVPSIANWVQATLPGIGGEGDFNDDGLVDDQDIDILWNVIRSEVAGDDDPGSDDNEDLNHDGFVNEDDVDHMLANLLDAGPNRQYGDADLDGGVGGLDYTAWRDRAGTGWAHGDFDGDGGVGGLDYTLWRTRPTEYPATVGQHAGQLAAVPEPATLILAALALPALAAALRPRSRDLRHQCTAPDAPRP